MPCEFLAPLSPLRFELHFHLAESSSLIQREKLSERARGMGERIVLKKEKQKNTKKQGSHGFSDLEWKGSVETRGGGWGGVGVGCMQIRTTCTRRSSRHTWLRNEGAKPLTCCLRTGQAWAGEEDVELAPVSSRPIVGERGEDGSSG